MKKKYILALLALTVISVFLWINFGFAENKGNNQDLSKKNFRYQVNEAYGYGEKLFYDVGYKFIKAGEGSFQIMPEPYYYNGRESYDIRFQVKSLKSLEWLYKVRDQYRTILDVGGIFPWKFFQRIREGNYKRDFYAEFDQVNHLAITKDTSVKTVPYVHDIVSAFYYIRTMDLESVAPNEIVRLHNFWDDTTFALGVKVRGKETIEVKAGKFECIVIEPLISEGGLFMSEGKILIWLSNDERRIPVKVATKILIGYIDAELTSYRGLRGPLESKIE